MTVSKDQVELLGILNKVFRELYKEAKEANANAPKQVIAKAITKDVKPIQAKKLGRPARHLSDDPVLRALKNRKSGYDVGTLASITGWAPGYASAHIAKLHNQGLVAKHRDGQRVIVTLIENSVNMSASEANKQEHGIFVTN